MNIYMPIACLLLVSLLSSCAQNPVSGKSDFVLMSEEQEIALGRKSHAEVLKQYPRYEDAALQRYVQEVGEKVAANSHRQGLFYRFTILDGEEINAFALPGGYIYITRGLLAYLNSEAELAAVLGHEVGHVTARHSVRQYTAQQAANIGLAIGSILMPQMRNQGAQNLANLFGNVLLRGYGREHELEADRLGAEYLARSDYQPAAMLGVIRVLKNQEVFERARAKTEGREARVYHGVFSTHPDNDTRLKQVVAKAKPLAGKQQNIGRETFLHHIDGLRFGPKPAEGVLRGQDFYHRDLGIALHFPKGWRVLNEPRRLVALPPKGGASLEVITADLNKRLSPRDFLIHRLKLENLRDGKKVHAGKLPGYTAVAWAKTPFGRRLTRFTVIYLHEQAYIFAGAPRKAGTEPRYRTDFLNTALSLHPLRPREYALGIPLKLGLLRSDARTRYRTLAADSPIPNDPEQQLRLLNSHYPAGKPKPGALLKIVE